MKSSGDILGDAVKDIHLKPARLIVKKCLLELDHIKLQIKLANFLVGKAYESERKSLNRYEYDKLIEPYDRLHHFVLASRPQDATAENLKQGYEEIDFDGETYYIR